jgi:hypothetical protein
MARPRFAEVRESFDGAAPEARQPGTIAAEPPEPGPPTTPARGGNPYEEIVDGCVRLGTAYPAEHMPIDRVAALLGYPT